MPVLVVERQNAMLGGVGNVVRNLISIGARATLLSVVGDDEVGRTLTQLVGEEDRVEPHLLVEPGRPSTEKTRFVASGQQLLRADRETRRWINERSAKDSCPESSWKVQTVRGGRPMQRVLLLSPASAARVL